MTEPAPGPWQSRYDRQSRSVAIEQVIDGTAVDEIAVVCLPHLATTKRDLVQAANARLIAAAPDLLAALENLDLAISDIAPDLGAHIPPGLGTQFPSFAKAWTQARMAIAKAKGR